MARPKGKKDSFKRIGNYHGRRSGAKDLWPRSKVNYYGRQSMLNAKGVFRAFL